MSKDIQFTVTGAKNRKQSQRSIVAALNSLDDRYMIEVVFEGNITKIQLLCEDFLLRPHETVHDHFGLLVCDVMALIFYRLKMSGH